MQSIVTTLGFVKNAKNYIEYDVGKVEKYSKKYKVHANMIEHQKHSNSFNSLNKKIEIVILSIKNKTALTGVTENCTVNK